MADAPLMIFVRAIIAADAAAVSRMLARNPALATARFEDGATRQAAAAYYLEPIGRYIYAGDTALHVAAAAYRHHVVEELVAARADVRARNRRGAEPQHAAAVRSPDAPACNPKAQAATIARLIAAGADPNAVDAGGVTPLHRAVRTRCAQAVKALLDGGADPKRRTKGGSTPMLLATLNTGRGGSGSRVAKAEQQRIVRLLQKRLEGATAA